MEKLLNINELVLVVGASYNTINSWYKFKKENPDNEYAKMLPDYIQENSKSARLWKNEDVWKLIQFKQNVPKGRNGVMGSITQKYIHKGEKDEKSTECDTVTEGN